MLKKWPLKIKKRKVFWFWEVPNVFSPIFHDYRVKTGRGYFVESSRREPNIDRIVSQCWEIYPELTQEMFEKTYYCQGFDSIDELYFYFWVMEGFSFPQLINRFRFHSGITTQVTRPIEFEGRPKKDLMRASTVSYDAFVKFTDIGKKLIVDRMGWIRSPLETVSDGPVYKVREGKEYCAFDVKPAFSARTGDETLFNTNQKILAEYFGIYMNKVVVDNSKTSGGKVREGLFAKTWVPELCRFSWRTGKTRAKYAMYKTKKEFLRDGGQL